MVSHITLVTQDLFIRAVLPSTHTTSAVLAFPSLVVFAPITIWLVDACHALPFMIPRSPCVISCLDTKYLVHKFDADLLRSIYAGPEGGRGREKGGRGREKGGRGRFLIP